MHCVCEASDNVGDNETLQESQTVTVSCDNFEFITEPPDMKTLFSRNGKLGHNVLWIISRISQCKVSSPTHG